MSRRKIQIYINEYLCVYVMHRLLSGTIVHRMVVQEIMMMEIKKVQLETLL